MDAVHIGDSMTIILIAHRLSTVEKCDSIFYSNGELKSQGTYEELIELMIVLEKASNK